MKKGKATVVDKVMAIFLAVVLVLGTGGTYSFAEDMPPTQPAQAVSAAAVATAAATDQSPKPEMPSPGNVTVNFKDVDILTVLNYLSEVSGVDIIPAPGVDSKVTMRLRDKPWETALDIVTRNYGYVYSREGDVIRIIPKSQINMEETITEVISLNNLIREIELAKATSGTGGAAGMGDVTVQQKEQSIQQLMGAVNSILDPKRGEKATYIGGVNSIVVTAVPSKISEIKKMVERIDRRTAQVVLDTKVVEITLGDTEKFGVDWNAVIKAAGARTALTFPFTNSGDLSFLPSQQRYYYPQSTDITGALLPGQNGFPYIGLSNLINPVSQTLVTNSANLYSFGTLDFTSFTATLTMLEQRGDTEILSAPRITTLDNQKATIKVIKKYMMQKTQETTQTAGIVTVEFENEADAREVGVKLTVIPHVNEKGEISVNLLPEVSTDITFTPVTVGVAGTTTVAMQYASREANTIVRCNDNETIFLGGLISKNTAKKNNKLPILGDLFGGVPWLGSAFKYDEDVTTRTEIAFFVTVHLVKDGMDSIRATDSMDRYNDYFVNKKKVIPPSKDSKNTRQIEEMQEEKAAQAAAKVSLQQGEVKTTENTVQIQVQNPAAVKPKKTNKPWFDFSDDKKK